MRFARKQPGAARPPPPPPPSPLPRLSQMHMQFHAQWAHCNDWGTCARQVSQADGVAALLPVHCRSQCCLP